jgi:hypothetical protein
MRITSKGQVTIPIEIREQAGRCRIPKSRSNSMAGVSRGGAIK